MAKERPILSNNISITDFQEFYWLKIELLVFCRKEGLRSSGSKLELTNQIIKYLRTGRTKIEKQSIAKPLSRFDWNIAELSGTTIITDNYKNTENVRTFFQAQIGKKFRFNVTFMNWCKANNGKTLNQAVTQWHKIQIDKKTKKRNLEIAPQFEFNKYIRDYFKDNPTGSRQIAIKLWNIKKNQRGSNKYQRSDLSLL